MRFPFSYWSWLQRLGIWILGMTFALAVFGQTKTDLASNQYLQLLGQLPETPSMKQIEDAKERGEAFHKAEIGKLDDGSESRKRADLLYSIFLKQLLARSVVAEFAAPMSLQVKWFYLRYGLMRETRELLEPTVAYYSALGRDSREAALAFFEFADFDERHPLRDNRSPSLRKMLDRLAKDRDFYTRSLEISERINGPQDELFLVTLFNLANNLFNCAEFELFIPVIEKFLLNVEKNLGRNWESVVHGLRLLAATKDAIGLTAEANAIRERILRLTKTTDEASLAIINLSARALDFGYKGMNSKTGVVRLEAIRYMRQSSNSTNQIPEKSGSLPDDAALPDSILVLIKLDEDGNVTNANAQTDNVKLKTKAETEVSKWRFRPFESNGTRRALSGFVSFHF